MPANTQSQIVTGANINNGVTTYVAEVGDGQAGNTPAQWSEAVGPHMDRSRITALTSETESSHKTTIRIVVPGASTKLSIPDVGPAHISIECKIPKEFDELDRGKVQAYLEAVVKHQNVQQMVYNHQPTT